MNLLIAAPAWLAWSLVAVLVAASLQDVTRLRISNLFSGAVAVGAVVAAALAGPQWSLWENLALFLITLFIGTFLFSAGIFGGGDVKLLAAILLWLDFAAAGRMLVVAAVAGGLFTILVWIARKPGWSERARSRFPLLQRQGGIAYAVALAVGTIAIMPQVGGVGVAPWENSLPH